MKINSILQTPNCAKDSKQVVLLSTNNSIPYKVGFSLNIMLFELNGNIGANQEH